MPLYLSHATYSPEAIAGLVDNPQNRAEVTRPILQALGANVEQVYFDVGGTEIYAILDVPDPTTLGAVSTAMYAAGSFTSIKISQIITADDSVEVFKKAGEIVYTPPSA